MAHHLSLEPLLIERLKACVTGARDVLSAADLAGVEESRQRFPAIQVLYLGDRFDDSAGAGRFLEVVQTWAVAIGVKHLSGSAEQRDLAGELITAAIAALQGWQPAGEFSRLARTNAPPPLYRAGGYAYFFLYFDCRVLTTGATD